AISLDPRIKLFDVKFEGLDDVEPLFTPDDYCIYDKYGDGDPFEDEGYIKREVNPENRRKYMLKTTSKGDELVPKVRQISKDWEKEVGITEEDKIVIERIQEIAINGMKLVEEL
ncbi:MAG: hypothetical protein J6Q86_05970, partial [Methanobrevibacter sp.]|nr:hypothetical protein [Methanobrevibacter sp.]